MLMPSVKEEPVIPNENQQFMDMNTFMYKFKVAQPGDKIVYHRGCLMRDVQLDTPHSKELLHLSRRIYRMARTEKLELFQQVIKTKNTVFEEGPKRRRVSADEHVYIAIKL
jgi:hypothetical protein